MRAGIGSPIRREAVFGGAGELLIWNLIEGTPHAPFASAAACQLAPGGHVGEFKEERNPELIIVLEGKGTATVNGASKALKEGDCLQIEVGATLSLKNDSADGPLRYLVVKGTPAGA
jgi:quercetin dioxygenase-like cupin family protein